MFVRVEGLGGWRSWSLFVFSNLLVQLCCIEVTRKRRFLGRRRVFLVVVHISCLLRFLGGFVPFSWINEKNCGNYLMYGIETDAYNF